MDAISVPTDKVLERRPDSLIQEHTQMPESSSDAEKAQDANQPESGAETSNEDENHAPVNHPGKPPDGGYGWVNVACNFFQNSVSWGINSIFGVYLSFYLENDFFPGATMFHFAMVGGLSASVGLVVGPFSNYITRRWHYKISMAIGAFFLSLGQIFAGLSTEIWQLFLTQGVMFGLGMGFVFVPALPIISQWFYKRRATAMGLASMGSGFGALVFSTTTRVAIEKQSLRFAFITNGVISFCVMVPVIYLYKDRVKLLDAKFEPFQFKLLGRWGFALICLWGSFSMLGYFISMFTLSTFAVDGLGRSQGDGSTVTSVLAAGQFVGRPILGLLLDYGGRINVACIATLIAGFSCLFIWLFTHIYPLLVFFGFVQGFFGGMFWGSAAPVTADVVGLQDLGSALSVLWITIAVPITFSQVISLELLNYSREVLERTGVYAYHISIGFAGGAFVVAAIFGLGIKFTVQGNFKLLKKT